MSFFTKKLDVTAKNSYEKWNRMYGSYIDNFKKKEAHMFSDDIVTSDLASADTPAQAKGIKTCNKRGIINNK